MKKFFFLLGLVLFASAPLLGGCSSDYAQSQDQDQAYQEQVQQPQQQSQKLQRPTSQDPKVQLAEFLVQSGAKMYTTGWCPTCKRQIGEFGQEAQALLKSIEINCEEKPDLCADKGVNKYPTWEFNGQLQKAGGFPLPELAQLAGFPNPQAFAQGGQMGGGMGQPYSPQDQSPYQSPYQPPYMQQSGGYPQ